MEVSFSDSFKKSFRKRTTITEPLFWDRLEVFINDPFESTLKTHHLSGKLKGQWSFSLDYTKRVVFYFTKDKPKKAVLVDIGNHDEIY